VIHQQDGDSLRRTPHFLAARLQTEFYPCYIHRLDGTKAKRNAICLSSSGAAGSEEQWFG
jgi:hypothetical protein